MREEAANPTKTDRPYANLDGTAIPLSEHEQKLFSQLGELARETRIPFELTPGINELLGSLSAAWYPRLVELEYGCGFLIMSGLPTTPLEDACAALWAIGLSLGIPVPQNKSGDLLVRVEDSGADLSKPTVRGHQSSQALPFHSDRCDLTVLLCIRPAHSGGITRVLSSVAAYSILTEHEPGHAKVLMSDFPHDQRGEELPGQPGWLMHPVFSIENGVFVSRYIRRFIEGSQRHFDAPRLTIQQIKALDALDFVLDNAGLAVDLPLHPGQLLVVNNHTTLHSRTAFDNHEVQSGRLLLRLWVASKLGRRLPSSFAPIFGTRTCGPPRGGILSVRSKTQSERVE